MQQSTFEERRRKRLLPPEIAVRCRNQLARFVANPILDFEGPLICRSLFVNSLFTTGYIIATDIVKKNTNYPRAVG